MFLIISSWAPPLRKGSPIMLHNLLSHFPRGSFMVLANGYGFEEVAKDDPQWLPVKYFFYNSVSKFAGGDRSGQRRTATNSPSKMLREALNTQLGQAWEIVKITRQAIKIIKQERVDFLLATSTGAPLISTLITHWFTRKPYFVFLFDLYADNFFRFWLEKVLAQVFEGPLLKNAKKVIVTNETTRDYYLKKYKVKSEIIHNSIIADNSLRQKKLVCRKPRRPYTIVFTGAVYWAQKDAIKNLIKAVGALPDLKIKLILYVPQPVKMLARQGIFPSRSVAVKSAPPDKIHGILKASADIAFLPLSFNTNAPEIIRTATPGKFSQYLISGVPILVHAPSDSAIARYASATNTAFVVGNNDTSALAQAVVKLLTDQKLRERLVANSQKLFWKNHDAVKNATRLKSILKN